MKSDEIIPDHPSPQAILEALEKQKTVKFTAFENWEVAMHFGPAPKMPGCDVAKLEYTASATTKDKTKIAKPNLSGSATRVDVEEKSVIWWYGNTTKDITDSIKKTFPQFEWMEKTDDR